MVKVYKRGRDIQTGQFIPLKDAEKHKSTAVIEKVTYPSKQPVSKYRTIKSAPKAGIISRESIQKAVKEISSPKKKK